MDINYSFSVLNKENNSIEIFSYHLINRIELLDLKRRYEKSEIMIYCNCKSKVPLNLSQTKIPFLYPKNRDKKHSKDCCRHPSYKKDIYFERYWEYNEQENKYKINIDLTNFIDLIDSNNSEFLEEYRVPLSFFIERLNIVTWESIIKGSKNKIPNNNNEFMKHLYGFSNNIYLNDKESSLFKLFYNNKAVIDIEAKTEIYFIYMEFIEIIDSYSNGKSLISLKNSINKYIRFYINTESLLKELKTVKYGEKIILSGFVNRESLFHKTYLTINEFCLLPIINEGLFISNKYEIEEFKKLIKENILFYKPSQKILEYGNYIPSFIILKLNEKSIICEIFSNKKSKEYLKIKDEKIRLFKERDFLKKYNSWYIELQ